MSILKLCKIISHVENMRFHYWRLQEVMFKSTEVKVPKVKWRYSARVLSKLQEVSNFSSTYRVSTLHMGRTEMLILKACCSVCGEHANLFLCPKKPVQIFEKEK